MTAVEHLLTCLGEECAEVAQDVAKSLRFGLDDRNVLNPSGPTNRERIIKELNDLLACADLLVDFGVLPANWQSADEQVLKKRKVAKFMNYAKEIGALEEYLA